MSVSHCVLEKAEFKDVKYYSDKQLLVLSVKNVLSGPLA